MAGVSLLCAILLLVKSFRCERCLFGNVVIEVDLIFPPLSKCPSMSFLFLELEGYFRSSNITPVAFLETPFSLSAFTYNDN